MVQQFILFMTNNYLNYLVENIGWIYVGVSNIKFCILCYLLALMEVCILYSRGYNCSFSQLKA